MLARYEPLEQIFFLVACAVFLLMPLAAGYLVIQPLHIHSCQHETAVRRYSLLDFIALAVQLQVALAVEMSAMGGGVLGPRLMVGGLILAGILAMWWAGVEAAVRAGVTDGWRRAAIHLLLLPGTAAVMAGTVLALASLGTFFDDFADVGLQDATLYSLLPIGGVFVGTVLLRLLAVWISQEPANAPP